MLDRMFASVEVNVTPGSITTSDTVLKNYFALMDAFLFDKADIFLKHKVNAALGLPWTIFWSPLSLLAHCENIYFSLNYLEVRWLKKETLESMYTTTVSEINKASRVFKEAQHSYPQFKDSLLDFSQLISETGLLVCLREELISIYRTLTQCRNPFVYEKCSEQLKRINDQVPSGFNHKYFYNIKFNVRTETSVLYHLLKTQVHLGNFDYTESVFHLYIAKSELEQWKGRFTEITVGKDQEALRPIRMGVFHWLYIFHRTLHSKLTFYFYEILLKNESKFSGDMNAACSQLETNYYSIVENFVNKSMCFSVCLVMDASSLIDKNLPTGIPSEGYLVEQQDPLQGLKCYPCIFKFPKVIQINLHWPNLVSLIIDNYVELNNYKDPLYHYDKALKFTYYYTKLDPRIVLVVMFKGERKSKDQVTQEFLYILSTHLRNWKVLNRLKPPDS